MITKSQAKYIQSLSHKKFRNEEGVFVAEGPKIINELLAEDNIDPVMMYALPEWINENTGLNKRFSNLRYETLKPADLDRVSFMSTGNQVLGIFKQPVFDNKKTDLQLMLDGIQDPGNLGTIVRIADWFGIERIVCSMDTADVFNPKVVQSTMGSIARVEMVYCELEEFILQHPQSYYAATLGGKSLAETGHIKNGVIVIGNESKGIRPEILQHIDNQVTIPKTGKAESLNAAVATGIILSHLVEQ